MNMLIALAAVAVAAGPESNNAALLEEVRTALHQAAEQTFHGRIEYRQEVHLPPQPERLADAARFAPQNAPLVGHPVADEKMRAMYERIHGRTLERAFNATVSVSDSAITIGHDGDIRLDRFENGDQIRTTAIRGGRLWEYTAGTSFLLTASQNVGGETTPGAQALHLAIREAESVAQCIVNQYVRQGDELLSTSVTADDHGGIVAQLADPAAHRTITLVRAGEGLRVHSMARNDGTGNITCRFFDYQKTNGAWLPSGFEYEWKPAGSEYTTRIVRTNSAVSTMNESQLSDAMSEPGPWTAGYEGLAYSQDFDVADSPLVPLRADLDLVERADE